MLGDGALSKYYNNLTEHFLYCFKPTVVMYWHINIVDTHVIL